MVSLPAILLILAGLSIGATVIAALIALRSAREARSAIFPIVREEETIRSQRARLATFLLSALTALFLGGWLATLRLFPTSEPAAVADAGPAQPANPPLITFVTETPPPAVEPPVTAPTPTQVQQVQVVATNTPLPPPTPLPVSTPAPAVEAAAAPATVALVSPTQPPAPTAIPPTATPVPPTVVPTDTLTPLPPTVTPTSAAIAAQVPTTAPRTPAPPGTRMGPIQFAADITPNIDAINPTDFFPQGTESVYAVYPYSGMVNGVDFAAVWYQNGVELWRDEQKWRWGSKAQFYSFLNPPGEGLYKLELYVNDSVVATGIFEIR
ncbi:MAG: hypothetical protein BroJett011_61600 [Chloroflexota bacterium]|nr:MAG: hypothetical protein BroJett011_61600 [Chloroflexota bacterium]